MERGTIHGRDDSSEVNVTFLLDNIVYVCLKHLNKLSTKSIVELWICPEMHANEFNELYDRHHKVSSTLNYY